MVYERCIYAKRIQDKNNRNIYVSTTLNIKTLFVKTEVTHKNDSLVCSEFYKGLTQEQASNGDYITAINEHLEIINNRVMDIGGIEKIESNEFMGCIIHQLLSIL